MNMSLYQIDEISSRISDLYKTTIQNGLVPVLTRQGIAIGSCLIKPSDGFFVIYKERHEYYRTYSKSAAMIIARLINKKSKPTDISEILEADRCAFWARNDLEVFKHHYNLAVKRNDSMRQELMEARFEATNDRYKMAKKTIKESYSKLF